ncbi:MAG: molybdopterin dinucleotide binding domain-containing protein [Methanomicrobiales archaeon]|nr:molybdopterin dinucleotide binding domain-containing protein [Methanomicrobiales archaeon]
MRLVFNTGRTIRQGNSVESKLSQEYEREVSTARLHPLDMLELGLENGDRLLIDAGRASIVVRAEESEEVEPGTLFLPLGPYANHLISEETHCTGMPDYKSIEVEAEWTDRPQVKITDLQKSLGGVPLDLS